VGGKNLTDNRFDAKKKRDGKTQKGKKESEVSEWVTKRQGSLLETGREKGTKMLEGIPRKKRRALISPALNATMCPRPGRDMGELGGRGAMGGKMTFASSKVCPSGDSTVPGQKFRSKTPGSNPWRKKGETEGKRKGWIKGNGNVVRGERNGVFIERVEMRNTDPAWTVQKQWRRHTHVFDLREKGSGGRKGRRCTADTSCKRLDRQKHKMQKENRSEVRTSVGVQVANQSYLSQKIYWENERNRD